MKILLLFSVFLASISFAKDSTIEWQWPEADCDGGVIFLDEIDQAEVYVDTSPIPSASEADGEGSCGATEDIPPASEIVEVITTDQTSVVIDLPSGGTYFVRMRVQVNGVWSNLSAQKEVTIPESRPQIPIIIRVGS